MWAFWYQILDAVQSCKVILVNIGQIHSFIHSAYTLPLKKWLCNNSLYWNSKETVSHTSVLEVWYLIWYKIVFEVNQVWEMLGLQISFPQGYSEALILGTGFLADSLRLLNIDSAQLP